MLRYEIINRICSRPRIDFFHQFREGVAHKRNAPYSNENVTRVEKKLSKNAYQNISRLFQIG